MAIIRIMPTIWKYEPVRFGTLTSNQVCDVAIIGGGIAGLWCAYMLAKVGKRVCVLEAKQLGSGTTAGSTAILTYAHDDIYHNLIKKHGAEVAKRYLEDSQNAISDIVEIAKNENFEMDLQPTDYVLFSQKWCGKQHLKKELRAYAELGQNVGQTATEGLPYATKFAIRGKGSYRLNPLKLVSCLANVITKRGGKIFENTAVTKAPEGETLEIGSHTVTAKHFIVATHFPYINAPGFYWLKMYQEQNYCMGISGLDKDFCKGTTYESTDKKGFEYRRVGDNILIDGAGVRTGQKPYRSKYQILQKHIARYFPDGKEIVRYCAQDCMTLDFLPYAGRYSHFADNVFVVAGFNKWGMTGSYVAAKVVTDMIAGKLDKDAPFDKNIYTPQRNVMLANIIAAAGNLGTVAASFVNNVLNLDAKKFARIKPGQGAIIRHKGHRVGASRDKDGKVHLLHAVCPHMGCNLKWNKDERTWDCPCHGSRFDTQGQIINNPSTMRCKKIK